MTSSWRRPSAFSTDNEFSLSQTDEIRIKASSSDGQATSRSGWSGHRPSERRKRWIVWIIHFIGFMVSRIE